MEAQRSEPQGMGRELSMLRRLEVGCWIHELHPHQPIMQAFQPNSKPLRICSKRGMWSGLIPNFPFPGGIREK